MSQIDRPARPSRRSSDASVFWYAAPIVGALLVAGATLLGSSMHPVMMPELARSKATPQPVAATPPASSTVGTATPQLAAAAVPSR